MIKHEHVQMINAWKKFLVHQETYGRFPSTDDIVSRYINVALTTNNTQLLDLVFDYLQMPSNLTIEEKISYYQLLGK